MTDDFPQNRNLKQDLSDENPTSGNQPAVKQPIGPGDIQGGDDNTRNAPRDGDIGAATLATHSGPEQTTDVNTARNVNARPDDLISTTSVSGERTEGSPIQQPTGEARNTSPA